MSAFGWIVVSGLSMSGIALAGAVIFLLGENARQRIILPLVAFSAGSLMGGAFLHMIPEAVVISNGDTSMYIWVLAGFSTFLALEQVLHWHHCHSESPEAKSPLTYLILIGDAFHNFLGGVAVAGAFLVDIGLGVSIWLATAAHELPQELGKYGVLLHGGWHWRRAMIVNTFTSLSFLVGGTLTVELEPAEPGCFVSRVEPDDGCDSTVVDDQGLLHFFGGDSLLHGCSPK